MCGIAGALAPRRDLPAARRAPPSASRRRWSTAGPDGHGFFSRGARRARAPAPVDHRSLRGRPPADDQRGRPDRHRRQRRDLQPRRAARRSRRQGASVSQRQRLRGGGRTSTKRSARACPSSCAACSPSRCGTRAARRCSWRAIASAKSRSTTVSGRTASSSPPSSARCSPTSGPPPASRCRRWTPIWRCSTSPAPTRSTRASRSSPPGTRWSSVAASGRWCAATIVPASRRRWQTSRRARGGARACAPRSRRRCRIALMSDVPLGAFLSGGVDSSIVVACMARATGAPVKTFSVGFSEGGREDNELPFARLVAERYRTDHHELIVEPDMTGLLPFDRAPPRRAVRRQLGGPDRYLCELARQHVTVALSGDAGDESFGGYRRYVWAHMADLLLRLPASDSRAARGRGAGGGAGWARALAARVRRAPRRPTRRRATSASSATSPPAKRPTSTRPSCVSASRATPPRRSSPASWPAARAVDVVSRLQDLDCDTYLPDDILAKVDIASMSHGLEARAPFCRSRRGRAGRRAAGPLQAAAAGRASTSSSRRSPISSPPRSSNGARRGSRCRRGAGWRAGCTDSRARLCSRTRRARAGLFAPAAVESLLERHRAGEDHGERIWNLIVLETWFRELVDGRASFVREAAARQAAIARAEPALASP